MSAKLQFKSYNPKQMSLFPDRLDVDIAENDPVRIVDMVIDDLKIGRFEKLYNDRGANPYHPKMMLKVIIYGYMNNIYSCRKIEKCLKRDIHFMWLADSQKPDFNTVNRFRNRFKDEINDIFTDIVVFLNEKGYITLEVEYQDGTKIESKANKYSFVWRKTVEKNKGKLLEKIKVLLEQIDEAIAQDYAEEYEPEKISSEELRKMAKKINESLATAPAPRTPEEKAAHKEKEQQVTALEGHADKLDEYDSKLEILGNRNSYSKTDHDATFMHMKEDAMNNGQTKPGYNLQIGTENQFITNFGIFQNRGDSPTLIPFAESFFERYNKFPQTNVADSGYGSEENYRFMEEAGIEAYVKYNMFHKEQRMHYEPDPFSIQGMFYNEEQDFYVCPMGQHLTKTGTTTSTTDTGYVTESTCYMAQRCEGCPLRGSCFDAKGNRKIEVNHRLIEYRKKARERLTSEEGIKHRGRRCIEPEAVFGQMKYNRQYKRFRHVGKDKVTMDFAFFAIAHNINKMCSIMRKNG